jgi:hypothetical protein
MNLTPVLVVGISVFGVYKLFELFVRKQERMAMVDKIDKLSEIEFKGTKIDLPAFSSYGKFTSLRIALLLMGVGLGFITGFILLLEGFIRDSRQESEILYFACIALFGGLGLLISYFIEASKEKRN